MSKVLVHLTLRDEPWEVDEDEVPGLQAQGLYVRHADQPAPNGAAKMKPAKEA